MQRHAPDSRWEVNPDYSNELGELAPAPHLQTAWDTPFLTWSDAWRVLAGSAALRDRHYPNAIS
jgi:hypothetical protein